MSIWTGTGLCDRCNEFVIGLRDGLCGICRMSAENAELRRRLARALWALREEAIKAEHYDGTFTRFDVSGMIAERRELRVRRSRKAAP
jgi:hypothetical protein